MKQKISIAIIMALVSFGTIFSPGKILAENDFFEVAGLIAGQSTRTAVENSYLEITTSDEDIISGYANVDGIISYCLAYFVGVVFSEFYCRTISEYDDIVKIFTKKFGRPDIVPEHPHSGDVPERTEWTAKNGNRFTVIRREDGKATINLESA